MSRFEPRLSDLSPSRKRLVLLGQRMAFGTLKDLRVSRCDPVFNPPPRVIVRRKIGAKPAKRTPRNDYALAQEWIEFFGDLDHIRDGVILKIDVCDGLPMCHEFEDSLLV